MADISDATSVEGEGPPRHASGIESPSGLSATQQEAEPAAASSQNESSEEPEAAELSQSPGAEQHAEAHEEPSPHDVQLPHDTESLEALPSDHPLLARAQKALQQQLETDQYRLESELREKTAELKDAKQKREDLGVELYGFQQQLAKLQMQLEKSQEQHVQVSQVRTEAEARVQQLRTAQDEEQQLTAQEKRKVDKYQADLDRLTSTLKQIELYNEEMKSEIAVTRRATYAAENAVQRLEKGKKEQDLLIDHLHGQIKGHQRQIALFTQQHAAQQRETRAAQETLAEAAAEMEGVAFEKKQLTAQWQSSLIAMQKRDEALKALEQAQDQQEEQGRSIENEIHAYRKDILREQVRNEQLTAILRKVEGEAKFLEGQSDTMRDKQARLQEVHARLQAALQSTEESLGHLRTEAKVLEGERIGVEKAIIKTNTDIQGLEGHMLDNLSEQTTAEKSAQKTAQETQQLRKQVYDEEMAVIQLQNELARLRVDILNTQAHNDRLKEALQLLDADLRGKMDTISKYEMSLLQLEIKRRTDEIEKKTKDVDLLNRRLERLSAASQGEENLGPLEATVNNLSREITRKNEDGRTLQRRWVQWQTELVALQADNNRLGEAVLRLKSEHTVVAQKRKRLAQQQEYVGKEVRELERGITHLRNNMARYNALTAENLALKHQLREDNRNLEFNISIELKEMEEAALSIQDNIARCKQDKQQTLEGIVDTEKQIMLWERKIQLEREMAEVMDPSVGTDVVGAMRREVHRMQLRLGDLGRLQERLIADMERSISKRETINTKGRAASLKKSPDITESALRRALAELERSVQDTRRESRATDTRVAQLEQGRLGLAEQVADASTRVDELRQQEAAARSAVDEASMQRHKVLLATSSQQQLAKYYEDAEAGRYRMHMSAEALEPELQRAQEKQQSIVAVMQDVMQHSPELQPALQKSMLRCGTAVT